MRSLIALIVKIVKKCCPRTQSLNFTTLRKQERRESVEETEIKQQKRRSLDRWMVDRMSRTDKPNKLCKPFKAQSIK